MKKVLHALFSVLFVVGFISIAAGHGGGLDSKGCHHNRKTGDYHCHRNPAASGSVGRQQLVPEPKAGGNAADRLRQLDSLRKQGLITDEEYEAKRRAILADL